MTFALLLLIGLTAGLRTLTPLVAISLGAMLGWIDLDGTWASFLAHVVAVTVLVLLAVLEIVGDKLPATPSRKVAPIFAARVGLGALAGALLGLPSGNWIAGLILGAIGGVLGTLGGHEARRRLAGAFGRDLPAALIEDAFTIVLALLVVYLA